MFAQKNFHAPGMMSYRFGIWFKIFLIVELTNLRGQNFKLDLYSENFLALKNERSLRTASLKHHRTVNTHSKATISNSF
jgi:hypothetical protein